MDIRKRDKRKPPARCTFHTPVPSCQVPAVKRAWVSSENPHT